MRVFVFVALAFVTLTSLGKTAPLSEADLKNLLGGIRQNRSTQADFQEERMIRLMMKPIRSSGRIWFQPPNKFRREVKGNSPSVTVSDGRQLWIYYPNFKSAERYPLGKGSPLDSTVAAINSALNLENIENMFQINGAKTEKGYEQSARRTHRYVAAERRSNRDDVFKPDARAGPCFHFRVQAAAGNRNNHAAGPVIKHE